MIHHDAFSQMLPLVISPSVRHPLKAHVRRQESPIRKSAAGLGLAKTLHEVGRQHHHLGDAEEAIQHYLKAQEL